VRGVSSEHGTMTPTGAVSDVSATPRVQLEVSVTKRLVIVDVWMVLRENIVTDASLVTTTSPTVRPATVIQLVLTRMLARMEFASVMPLEPVRARRLLLVRNVPRVSEDILGCRRAAVKDARNVSASGGHETATRPATAGPSWSAPAGGSSPLAGETATSPWRTASSSYLVTIMMLSLESITFLMYLFIGDYLKCFWETKFCPTMVT